LRSIDNIHSHVCFLQITNNSYWKEKINLSFIHFFCFVGPVRASIIYHIYWGKTFEIHICHMRSHTLRENYPMHWRITFENFFATSSNYPSNIFAPIEIEKELDIFEEASFIEVSIIIIDWKVCNLAIAIILFPFANYGGKGKKKTPPYIIITFWFIFGEGGRIEERKEKALIDHSWGKIPYCIIEHSLFYDHSIHTWFHNFEGKIIIHWTQKQGSPYWEPSILSDSHPIFLRNIFLRGNIPWSHIIIIENCILRARASPISIELRKTMPFSNCIILNNIISFYILIPLRVCHYPFIEITSYCPFLRKKEHHLGYHHLIKMNEYCAHHHSFQCYLLEAI